MKRRTLLAILALAVIFVTSLLLLRDREFQRESYQGKHTRDWAMLMITTQAGSNRDEAISALRALGPKAVPPLRRMLLESDKFYEKPVVQAARVLPAAQRRLLLQQLRPGQAMSHRLAALAAVAAIGPPAADAIPELVQSLANPNGQIRWDAARALGAMGETATGVLVSAATGTNAGMRHAAVFALAQVGTNPPPVIATLFNATLDSDETVRTLAMYYVGQLALDATPMLLEKLGSTDPATQVAAMRALAGVRPQVRLITTNLLSLATNSSGNLRRQTIETMGALRVANSNSAAIMVSALDDPDPAIRLAAMNAVGQISWKTAAALPRLEDFTRSTNTLERGSATRALGLYGARASNAAPAITLLLADPELEVRAAATNALGNIHATTSPL